MRRQQQLNDRNERVKIKGRLQKHSREEAQTQGEMMIWEEKETEQRLKPDCQKNRVKNEKKERFQAIKKRRKRNHMITEGAKDEQEKRKGLEEAG